MLLTIPALQFPSLAAVQVDKLLKALSAAQESLVSSVGGLRGVEGGLTAPGTGIAGQPHEAIDSITGTSQQLNEVLRRVNQAQAELPAIRDPAEIPSAQELAAVRLRDVDTQTQEELNASMPEFLSTTTSHACKIGPFQYRRLRNGDIYKGRYARSKKCGDGCYAFMNGDVYEGEFQEDHMQARPPVNRPLHHHSLQLSLAVCAHCGKRYGCS